MTENEERKVAKVVEIVAKEMESKGDNAWDAVYKVFWFEDMKEWCLCPTYQGYEWGGKNEAVAVFSDIELASAFARVLNQCGLPWVKANRHFLEVNFPGREVSAE